jgi:hypothetical protein
MDVCLGDPRTTEKQRHFGRGGTKGKPDLPVSCLSMMGGRGRGGEKSEPQGNGRSAREKRMGQRVQKIHTVELTVFYHRKSRSDASEVRHA